MERSIQFAMEKLREYLDAGVNPNDALMSAANVAQRKYGGTYSDIKQTIAFLQFGIVA